MRFGAPPVFADEARYVFTPESSVKFNLTHPLHEIMGESHRILGEIVVTTGSDPQLKLPLSMTVPFRSFASGSGSRDRNLLTTVNAYRYPKITLVLDSVTWGSKHTEGPKSMAEGVATGTLTLHGITKPVQVALRGHVLPDSLEMDSQFTLLLSDFGIDRPSLFFRAVDDLAKLNVHGIAHKI